MEEEEKKSFLFFYQVYMKLQKLQRCVVKSSKTKKIQNIVLITLKKGD